MKVKFKFSIYDKVQNKLGKHGVVTNLGVNKHGTPMLWVVYNDMNIKDTWEFEKACNSAPSFKAKSIAVDFYFGILDSVTSPLSEGIVTFMDYNEDEKVSCIVSNDQQGVSDDWWPASSLKLLPKLIKDKKKVKRKGA